MMSCEILDRATNSLLPIEVSAAQVQLGQNSSKAISSGNVITLSVAILGVNIVNGQTETNYEVKISESSNDGKFISGGTTSATTQAGVVTAAGFSNSDVEVKCKPINL